MFKVKRQHSYPAYIWDAPGETAEAALENWQHCFGEDFVLVDPKTGKAMAK